jgi:hypothetical protein
MIVNRIVILTQDGDIKELGTITNSNDIESFFCNDMICTDTSFEFNDSQFHIDKVFLMKNGKEVEINLYVSYL